MHYNYIKNICSIFFLKEDLWNRYCVPGRAIRNEKHQCTETYFNPITLVDLNGNVVYPQFWDKSSAVLENVLQHQQHCCQESRNKISSQELFLHLAGNFCHLILECHIIYLLFTKAFCKSRLSCAEIEV